MRIKNDKLIQRIPFVAALLLLTLLLSSKGNAQLPDYHVQLFDESDGIRTDVEHVIKDDLGFIWLTYADHVQRFDGKQIHEYAIGDRINSILEDRDENIWITSRSQVYLYERSKQSFRKVDLEDIENLTIGSAIQLPGQAVWLQTSLGFYTLDAERLLFLPVTDEKLKIKTPVNPRRFSSTQSGNTFFYNSGDSLWSIDIASGVQRHLPVKSLLSMFALNESKVLVSTWTYQTFLYDLQAQTIQSIHPAKYLLPDLDDFLTINAVVNLDSNAYLLATTKGILEFNLSSGHLSRKLLYNKGQPLLNVGRIVDLYMDQERKVWASSENSLLVFDPLNEVIGLKRISETDQFNGLNSQIRNFAADQKGNLWLSTNNGIIYWNLSSNEQTSIFAVEGATDRMNHPSVRGIAFDGQFVIIGQTNRGIWLYDPDTKKYRRPVYEPGPRGAAVQKKLESDFIDQLYRLRNGHYFIAARDQGYLLEAGSYMIREVDFPGSHENLNFCYEDQLGQVWIGTATSIYGLDSNLVQKYSIKEGIGSGAKRSLLQWNKSEYILGAKGLYAFNLSGDKITTRILSPYFENINIHSMFRDSSDRLWLGTDQGLYRFTMETGWIESFDRFDHSQGDYFNGNSIYYNEEGMLFMGGTNGINYFRPDEIKTRTDSLTISILKITVNQDDSSFHNRDALLSLKASQNYIEIDYIAPFYGNPNRLQYRYQLSGLYDEWKNVGENTTVRFTSLRPGQYAFKVAASINGIDWFENRDIVSFAIAYPFWQTWWFITCCVTVIVALIYYFVRKRIQSIRQKEQVKRDYEKRIAEVEMHALRAQMNPHFMFNSLNSINNFILKNDPDNASGYLTKFSRLMRLILDNSRSEWVLLEHELKALELYIELEIVRFDKVFDYQIIVSPDIDVTTTSVPPMIIQPYVENAIWHGLMHRKEPGGKLIIRLWREQQLLHICIEDNGVGREEAKRQKSKSATRHKSHGMKITAERIEIVNRIYDVDATVQIEDVAGQNGSVGGTRVSLTLADKKHDSHHSG